MNLMLVLLAVTAFPVGCLAFVLWMGALEDSIPAGVRRALREPDPSPILSVPVRRTAAPRADGWWEGVVAAASVADAMPAPPAPEAIPEQRTPTVRPLLPAPVLPAEPLTGT